MANLCLTNAEIQAEMAKLNVGEHQAEMAKADHNPECFFPNQRAFVHNEIKAVNKTTREILHTISTNSKDRVGDIVEPRGADLSNYLRNRIVMANHDYRIEMAIGKAISITQEESALVARTAFLETPLGEAAFRLAQEGIGGWSIGFRPIKYAVMEDESGTRRGYRFTKWELLEYSMVAIPMNQDAVMNCVQRGLIQESQVPIFAVVQPAEKAAAVVTPTVKAADEERRVVEMTLDSLARFVKARDERGRVAAAVSRTARRLQLQDAGKRIEDILGRYDGQGHR